MALVSTFVKAQKELLSIEQDEERGLIKDSLGSLSAAQCEDEGISLLSLEVDHIRTGLYGRVVVCLKRMNGGVLPQTSSFKVGDEVQVYAPKLQHTPSADASTFTGVVSKCSSHGVEVVSSDGEVDEDLMSSSRPLRMNMLASEATHKKMMYALNDLDALHPSDKSWPLVSLLVECNPLEVNLGVSEPLTVPVVMGEGEHLSTSTSTGDSSDFTPGARMSTAPAVIPVLPGLNETQVQAVQTALRAPYLAAIHGPPGTGKTTTVTELILQCVKRGQRVLVCAPSNAAVDNIVERLSPAALERVTGCAVQSERGKAKGKKGRAQAAASAIRAPQMVRLGHPARMSETIRPHCLEALIQANDGMEVVDDVRKEIDLLRKEMSNPKTRGAQRREMRGEAKALRKEIRAREENIVRSILRSRDVVLSTCVGAAHGLLRSMVGRGELQFDLCIIDEAAQALEVSCWIPMMHAGKCVLAGDHCQLPPTIKSDRAVAGGLGITLFERVLNNTPAVKAIPAITTTSTEPETAVSKARGGRFDRLSDCARLLSIQYRMHDAICSWASGAMYQDRLLSHSSVEAHTLADIAPQAQAQAQTKAQADGDSSAQAASAVLVMLDTCGCDMYEDEEDEEEEGETGKGSSSSSNMGKKGRSKRNKAEAALVAKHVSALLNPQCGGLSPAQVGVITPYNGQLRVLRHLLKPLYPGLEVKTVDSFQGGEKEAIVLSLVRSNGDGEVGFLRDSRRINVAVTRAKRHLCVVCDSETVCHDPFVASLVEHVSTRGLHLSASDFFDETLGGGGGGASKKNKKGANESIRQSENGKERERGRKEEGPADEELQAIVALFASRALSGGVLSWQPQQQQVGSCGDNISDNSPGGEAQQQQQQQQRKDQGLPPGWAVSASSASQNQREQGLLSFPPILSPRHRAVVHEATEIVVVAATAGDTHTRGVVASASKGEGKSRFLQLSWTMKAEVGAHVDAADEEMGKEEEEAEEEEGENYREEETVSSILQDPVFISPAAPAAPAAPAPAQAVKAIAMAVGAAVVAKSSAGADIAAAVTKKKKKKSNNNKKSKSGGGGGDGNGGDEHVLGLGGHILGSSDSGSGSGHVLPPTHPSFRLRPPSAPASAAVPDSVVGKALKQSSSSSKGKAKGKDGGGDVLDDDALLALAISENTQRAADRVQAQQGYRERYRSGGGVVPMPNYEKVQTEQRLAARLQELSDARLGKSKRGEGEEDTSLSMAGQQRPAAGSYNGPVAVNKARAAAVVERAKAAAAKRKAEKEKKEMEKEARS
jgi:superfamily I DNA and/or RNA helicase